MYFGWCLHPKIHTMSAIATDFGMDKALKTLGLKDINEGTSTGAKNFGSGTIISSYSPVDGQLIGQVKTTSQEDYDKVMQAATKAFQDFRMMPAPQRGEIVRQFGCLLYTSPSPRDLSTSRMPSSA